MKYNSLNEFLDYVKTRDEHQPEFLQAVEEVMTSLWPFIEKNPRYADHGLLERLVEPERAIQFRVSWVDDQGQKLSINFLYKSYSVLRIDKIMKLSK